MRKIFIPALVLLFSNKVISQASTDAAKSKATENISTLTKTKELKDGWAKSGSFNLNLTEAGRNNAWGVVKGGEEQAIGLKALIDYDFDHKKGKTSWLNNVRMRYGLSKLSSAGNGFVKTDDNINITSIIAKEVKPSLSVSALFSLNSQFDKYFLSPGEIRLGPGLLYKPNAHFSVMFSPVMANHTTKFATEDKNINLYGVDSAKTIKLGLGSFAQFKADYTIAKGITYKGFATFYSDYLNKPDVVIVDWTNLFNFTVNKYIGATFSLNLRYNDWEVGQLQLQHGMGIGFSYKL